MTARTTHPVETNEASFTARSKEVRSHADLAHHPLPLLMPALLARSPATFTLRLERGATVRTFRVVEGVVVASASKDPREHLGQVMAMLGMVEVTLAADAFGRAREEGILLGALLLRDRTVEVERLHEALSHKAREALFDCYGWTCGELEVLPIREPVSPQGGVAVRLPLESLHKEGLGRLREWKSFREHFPENDASFRAHRHVAQEWRSLEEDRLVELAEGGASLGELLASGREGPLVSARRLLRLYRQGVLTPRAAKGPRVGEAVDLARLVALVRTLIAEGRYDSAAAVAAQAVERAVLPEACALYREAEAFLRRSVAAELESLEAPEGSVSVRPLPKPLPPSITAADLHLHGLLGRSASLRDVLENSALDALGVWRGLRRLQASGLIRIVGSSPT